MSVQETNESSQRPEISPKIGRYIEVLDTAQKIAQHKYGTSIDGLRQQGEPTNDYSRISEVISEADKVIGSEDQFESDYHMWQETRQAGSHKMGFHEWRLSRNKAYKAEYERLSKELDETNK